MIALDLFAGCGGASLGLVAAGLDLVGAYDHDRIAVRAHRALLPSCPVEQVAIEQLVELPVADLWWASPPCQPFSAAGARRGSRDERDGYPALLDLVWRHRPRWLAIENVPGLAQHTGSCPRTPLFPTSGCNACYFARILAELAAVYPAGGAVRRVARSTSLHKRCELRLIFTSSPQDCSPTGARARGEPAPSTCPRRRSRQKVQRSSLSTSAISGTTGSVRSRCPSALRCNAFPTCAS